MRARVALNPYAATCTFTDSRKAFQRLSGADPEDARGMTASHEDGWIVGVFDGSLDTAVHECTHVVLDLLDSRGMDPLDSQGEAMAYMMGWLSAQAVRVLGLKNN